MSVKHRSSMAFSDPRAALIEATASLLTEVEPSALSLREVARRLGLSSGAPYHHFADKHLLLAAVAERSWSELFEAMESADTGEASLYRRGRAYLEFALDRPQLYALMFLPELRDPERYTSLHDASSRTLFRFMEVVAREDDAPPDDPARMGRVLASWSTVHGFAVLYNAGVLEGKLDPRLLSSVTE